jgi:hypothetical protein
MTAILDAVDRSTRLAIPEVVAELVKVLRTPMVAVIGGGRSTRSVRGWIHGEHAPRNDHGLRAALHVLDVFLAAHYKSDTIRAWFGGMNHLLEDDNPAMLLGKHFTPEQAKRVLLAARQFVSTD